MSAFRRLVGLVGWAGLALAFPHNVHQSPDGVGFRGRQSSVRRFINTVCQSKTTSIRDEDVAGPKNARRHLLVSAVTMTTVMGTTHLPLVASHADAAPPFAVIAEELGYFPVSYKNETVMVAKRVSRESSEQAIQLAKFLNEKGAVIYTAYWCPHCARQKELFGRQAWSLIANVECAPKGYNSRPAVCLANQVDGYPTWVIGRNSNRQQVISGERELEDLAKAVGFRGFRPDLELNVPPTLGSSSCQQ